MNETYTRFLKDMKDMVEFEGVGRIQEVYNGRCSYRGPAVVVTPAERQFVGEYTELDLKAETLGKEIVLYPG